ncbi:PilZ domain-containing protein [Thermovibrio ammonificans]|uniref:Type IV pilus assembly PilZ n=1 Tax=Thermovibrio ammonificans (strain DSM 15698 / JCM 12110 / HB-1) TaxID=648996 RepID=E8T3J8_THEA1|nr:PilZ domain-containing protein [Thermovibrio ammonificans]ADU96129.1 type IV pilus assembly PilZ [Thermovibrio ammonificans HB-1]
MGRRSDGVVYYKVRCPGGREITVPILFSFKGEESEEGVVATSFSPPGIVEILKKRQFFLIKENSRRRTVLVKGKVKWCKGNSCLFQLDEEVIEEKRFYERFVFCPEELGEFELHLKNGERIPVKVLDISMSGIKLLVERYGEKVSAGETLLLTQETRFLTVKVVRVEREKRGAVVGCKIVNTNFNLIGFIINRYIERVAQILESFSRST